MFCSKCGAENDDNNYACTECGTVLSRYSAPQSPPPRTGSDLSGLIPYRNPLALTSYYLGVFSFIPFLGILLGIPAFFMGMKGLQVSKEHPESKGSVHAWIGIICGGVFGFGYLALVIWMAARR